MPTTERSMVEDRSTRRYLKLALQRVEQAAADLRLAGAVPAVAFPRGIDEALDQVIATERLLRDQLES